MASLCLLRPSFRSVGQGAPGRAAVHGPFEWSTSRGTQVPLIQSSRGPRFVFSARCYQIAISSITPKFNPAIPCQIKPRPPRCWWWDNDFVAMIMMVDGWVSDTVLRSSPPHGVYVLTGPPASLSAALGPPIPHPSRPDSQVYYVKLPQIRLKLVTAFWCGRRGRGESRRSGRQTGERSDHQTGVERGIIPDLLQGPVGHSTCEIFKESNHITTVCSLGNAHGLKICLKEEYLDLYLNFVKMYTNFQHLLSWTGNGWINFL